MQETKFESTSRNVMAETSLTSAENPDASRLRTAKFDIGQIVKHRYYPFRGVIFDVDPEFNNSEEWYESIPEDVRPSKDQPFYHLLAENEQTTYIAYVSEQNLVTDPRKDAISHPAVADMFGQLKDGHYEIVAAKH